MKILTLDDLTNELPTDGNITDYFKMLHTETDDRGCAIMGAAFVEHCLGVSIRARIVDPGETTSALWFKGPNAPFKTFSAKIQLGMALAIYGPQMHRQLSAIKNIRNVFAHRALPLEFSQPALIEQIYQLAPFIKNSKEIEWKTAFSTGCMAIGTSLVNDAIAHGGKTMETSFP